MVIVPSFTPHSVGFVPTAFVMVGWTGAVKTCGVPKTSQVSSEFLTTILYVPAARPLKVFEFCQDPAAPPLIEY